MIAVDTNVLVRLVTLDDPAQHAQAVEVFERNAAYISRTVLLETAWVLAGSYQLTRETIAQALRGIAGMPNVVVEEADAVARAIEWYEAGMDVADALHLATCPEVEAFVTFDRKMARRSRAVGPTIPVRLLGG